MSEEQKEKVIDYLDGLEEINPAGKLIIGAIITQADLKKEIEALILSKGGLILDSSYHPDNILMDLVWAFEKSSIVALDTVNPLSNKVTEQLFNLGESGQTVTNVLGGEQQILSVGEKSRLVLIFDDLKYGSEKINNLPASVCRI
jgi:hypothetical protein